MNQVEIKKLASEIIGDGQDPNKFFVTISPYIQVETDGDFEYDSEILEGYSKDDMVTSVFDTFKDANEFYDSIDLDPHLGSGSVMIEDRKTGTIKEKTLTKILMIDYSYSEYDNSKMFGYTK